ncbi:hypothetical protein PsorP6_003582 [Peronosclerospora sorghi]|uniref:Uncharacterized protein n=1 Tax=Peronosclerospora sorghi TaxID=230839 RepID=A0ACC0VQ94_9STRA|nr:hypothetical protein PsorP6_003582 [Peronosclerospora sorghi]
MEKQPELTDMLKEPLIIFRKCGHISIVLDYMSSVESFPIGHVAIESVTVHTERKPAQILSQQPGHSMKFLFANEVSSHVL